MAETTQAQDNTENTATRYHRQIAAELAIGIGQVAATAGLIAEGGTVPFIARYRKEVTGSLDEVAITAIRDRLEQLADLDKRREAILKSLAERELLTDDLQVKIIAAATLSVLEDLYLPYRPKRRTRATIAREKGLEALAQQLFDQVEFDPLAAAAPFIDPEKGVGTAEEALAGARDIIAEWVNEHEQARARMREFFLAKAVFHTQVLTGKEVEGSRYRDYFDWEELAAKAPSHRILAMRRGEKEEFLSLRVMPPEAEALTLLTDIFVRGEGPVAAQVRLAVEDSYRRLLSGAMETEIRLATKKRAGFLATICASSCWPHRWVRSGSSPLIRASGRAARPLVSMPRASCSTMKRSFPSSPPVSRRRPPCGSGPSVGSLLLKLSPSAMGPAGGKQRTFCARWSCRRPSRLSW
jgi:uncharacterized protein